MKGWNRNKIDIISGLKNSNSKEAYELLLELEKQAAESDILYGYFDDFVKLTNDESSYVRIRGFRLVCAQAQWDTENKLGKNINALLCMLSDVKPIAVRQCLAALHSVVLYKPELTNSIIEQLQRLDLSKYKDSMAPLIEKDIEELLKVME